MEIQALNGSSAKLTLTALETAARQATGKARATITGLIQSLSPQPAARGRSAKEVSMRKHKKRATSKKVAAPKKHNPTKAKVVHHYHAKKHTTKHNPSKGGGFASKLNTGSILEAVKEGGLVAAGALGSSFVQRQTERFLPNLNPLVQGLVASSLVAGLGIYFGGNYGKHVAAGSIAEFVRSAGREYLPGMFSGTGPDDDGAVAGVDGYWDENGQWVMAGTDYAGLSYNLSDGVPVSSLRPAGI